MKVLDQSERLVGHSVPTVSLRATDGHSYDLSGLNGVSVVYVYPRTSPPDSAPVEGWDQIPGARGCTPQSCGFRDEHKGLRDAGVARVFGLSTQDTDYQNEVVQRLSLPFALLSDSELKFGQALGLETFEAGGMILLKRITLIIEDAFVRHVMFPVTEPGQNAADVIVYLTRHRGAR